MATQFINRTKRAISHARSAGPALGWKWVLREKYLRRMGVREVQFHPIGLPHPVFCRVVSSDIFEYTHLLGRGRSAFGLPFRPKYIIDAGANVGYSALRFHCDYPEAIIIAIEPASVNIVQLEKNCQHYPCITIEHAAVWSHATQLSIRSLQAGDNAFRVEKAKDGDIRAISISDIIETHSLPRIDLLKIDIEGSEIELFRGNTDWLKQVRMMLIETHDIYFPESTKIVDGAMKDRFQFEGIFGEYRLYVAKGLAG